MSLGHGGNIPAGRCFAFDALNPKCYSGTGTTFKEIISGTSTTAVVTSSLQMDSSLGRPHLRFTPAEVTRSAYIPFTVNLYDGPGVKVPTGSSCAWSWWSYLEDQGNASHVVMGWENGGASIGANGFLFWTGWGTDGPRYGIAGTAYSIYNNLATADRFLTGVWQNWTVTFEGAVTNGLKTYRNGILLDETTPTTATISGLNNNQLFIGASNVSGGNWGGYLDVVNMWNRALSASEVSDLYEIYKGRF